MYIDFR